MTNEGRRGIALVTGGGTGIGRAIAAALGRDGWHVVLCGRRAPVLDDAVRHLRDAGSGAEAIVADVGDPASVAALFSSIEQRHGRLDLLVNNAGSGAPAVPIDELSFADWQRVVSANLTGTFLCTQQAFALMKRQRPRGGRIVNNGSISSMAPRPNSAPYTATKHAVTGLTKSAALDGRAFDIACGQIDIGNAASDMTAAMEAGVLQPDGTTRPEPVMDVALVGEAVARMAALPPGANVLSMTIMATKMPFVGRG